MILKTTLEAFSKNTSKVYQLHFPLPKEKVEEFVGSNNNKRVICTINGKKQIRSGLMPFKDYWFILCSEQLKKELFLEEGVPVVLLLEKDESKYGMDMPEELAVLLDQEEEATAFFHKLTPGKQRNLIYIVYQVKNQDSRLNKALAIVNHLKQEKGKLDFKKLNELIKYYHQQNKMK